MSKKVSEFKVTKQISDFKVSKQTFEYKVSNRTIVCELAFAADGADKGSIGVYRTHRSYTLLSLSPYRLRCTILSILYYTFSFCRLAVAGL